MVNGKTPLVLTLAGTLLLVGVLLIWQPYSGSSPSEWDAYTPPVRRFLDAASRRDTAQLYQQSLGARAVQWALAAAQYRPDSVAHWARHAYAWAGNHHGDTAEVFVWVSNSQCNLVLEFIGVAEAAKVEEASSACFEEH